MVPALRPLICDAGRRKFIVGRWRPCFLRGTCGRDSGDAAQPHPKVEGHTALLHGLRGVEGGSSHWLSILKLSCTWSPN